MVWITGKCRRITAPTVPFNMRLHIDSRMSLQRNAILRGGPYVNWNYPQIEMTNCLGNELATNELKCLIIAIVFRFFWNRVSWEKGERERGLSKEAVISTGTIMIVPVLLIDGQWAIKCFFHCHFAVRFSYCLLTIPLYLQFETFECLCSSVIIGSAWFPDSHSCRWHNW